MLRSSITFAPQFGRELLCVVSRDGRTAILSIALGEPLRSETIVATQGRSSPRLGYSPGSDGYLVGYSGEGGTYDLHLFGSEGRPIGRLQADGTLGECLYSPSGTRVAAGFYSARRRYSLGGTTATGAGIHLWDREGNEPMDLLSRRADKIPAMGFLDEDRILFVASNLEVLGNAVYVANARDRSVERLECDTIPILPLLPPFRHGRR